MKKSFYFFLFCFSLMPYLANGQGCDGLIKDARTFIKNLKFDEAVKKVEAAKGCASQAEIDKLYSEIFSGLKKQSKEALLAQKRSEQSEKQVKEAFALLAIEQQKTQEALSHLKISKSLTDSVLLKSKKLINSIYFYKDKFALAQRKTDSTILFGFINPLGEETIHFSFTNAKPFNEETGYAAVELQKDKETKKFHIDTLGNWVATNQDEMNSDIDLIDLRRQNLDSIPSFICQSSKVSTILLSENKIKQLPPFLFNLKNLKILDLSLNEIEEVPEDIENLSNIETINLTGNQIDSLPHGIGKLNNLISLHLSYNNLKTIPPLTNLKKLTSLRIAYNKLKDFPEICSLESISDINFSKNEIHSIPESINLMRDLKLLDLSQNKISILPTTIGKLSQLTYINLSGNQLTFIPNEFRSLNQLSFANLSINQITSFPWETLQSSACTIGYNENIGIEGDSLNQCPTINLIENNIADIPIDIEKFLETKILLYGNPVWEKIYYGNRVLRDALNLNNFDKLMEIGERYYNAGLWLDAKQVFMKADSISPSSEIKIRLLQISENLKIPYTFSELIKEDDREILYGLANYFLEKEKLNEASQLFEKAESKEHSSEVLLQLFSIAEKMGKPFSFSRFLGSENAKELSYYGSYFFDKGNWAEAKELYTKSESKKHSVESTVKLFFISEKMGELADFSQFMLSKNARELDEYAQRFMNEADKEEEYKYRVPNMQRALLLREKQLLLDSSTYLRKRVAVEYNSLGYYQVFKPDGIGAEKSCRRVLELDPTNKYPHTNLPLALLLQNRQNEAKNYYLEWMSKPFGIQNFAKYRDAFLDDLKNLEKADVIEIDFELVRSWLK